MNDHEQVLAKLGRGITPEESAQFSRTYDCRTISERVDELNAQVAALHAEMRALSEQMQTLQKLVRNENRLVNKLFKALEQDKETV